MNKRLLFILSFVLISSGSAMAQTKKITNADLDKFREKRQQAERDYERNYEKLGMPSPEELTRQAAEKSRELAETAARYRAERLQEEQLQAQHEQAEAAAQIYYSQSSSGYSGGYGYNNFGYAPYNYYSSGVYGNGYYNGGYYNNRANRYYNNRGNTTQNRYNNYRQYGNQIPPIRVLTPSNMIRYAPITTTRSNPGRGRH